MTARAWLLAAILCLSLAAQDSGYREQGYREQIEVEWVLVPAVVRTPAGYVHGLEVDDFRLSADGRPVAVESFEARTDAPVSLLHLQDLSGSMALGGKLETSRRMLRCLLDRALPGDEFALASFASARVDVEVPLTSEVAALREAMAVWRGYGTTGLHDAVAWLPEIAVRDHGVKRAVVLITDGTDNASVVEPARARDMVRRAELPVYVLGLESGRPAERERQPQEPPPDGGWLERLARETGGRYRSISRGENVEAVCAAFADDLRSQYILGFPTGGSGEARYRTLKIEIPGRSVTVQHRRGYVGRLPASSPGQRH